ncbi:MAG: hypothetical protein R6V85_01255 [Polyangia bacterium]
MGEKRNAISDPAAGSRLARLGVLGLFAALAIYFGFTPTGGWNVWWHLAVGRAALDGVPLGVDPFSFTFAAEPWPYKDLPAAVLMYLGFDFWGYVWLAALKGLAALAIAIGVGLIAPAGRRSPKTALLVGGLALCAVQYRLVERPLLFSLALFPLLTAALEHARRRWSEVGGGAAARAYLLAVALVAAWSLLHRAALVGHGLLVAYALAAWSARLGGRFAETRLLPGGPPSREMLLAASLAPLAAGALSLLNPDGAALWSTALQVARSSALRELIADWSPIGPLELVLDFPIVAALVALAAAGWVAQLVAGRARGEGEGGPSLLHGALLVLFTGLALGDSARWVPYAALQAAAVLILVLTSPGPPLPAFLLRVGRARGSGVLAAVLVGALAVSGNEFGSGIGPMERRYPHGAVAFARARGLGGNLANAYHLGGYAIWHLWPEARVLVDGRNETLYPARFLERALRSQRNAGVFFELIEDRDVDWVLAGNTPGRETHLFLSRNPEWMLVFWSEEALLYARRSARPDLEDLEFQRLDPAAVDASIASAAARARGRPERLVELGREVRRMVAASPGGPRALTALALLLHFSGPGKHAERDQVLEELRNRHPDHPAVKELHRRLRGD